MIASKSRPQWGVFVSLLATIALAIAMIAVPAPKAEAQTAQLSNGSQATVTGSISRGDVNFSDGTRTRPRMFFVDGSGLSDAAPNQNYYAYCIEMGRADNVAGVQQTSGVIRSFTDVYSSGDEGVRFFVCGGLVYK